MASIRVVYMLLTHHLPELVHRLVHVLVDEGTNFVVVHHDFSKGPLPPFERSNVHVLRDFVVTRRGDMTPVLATLRGIDWIRRELDYDWVVLLSGQDYPVTPLAQIEAQLGASPYDAYVRTETTPEATRICRKRYYRRWYSVKIPFRKRKRVTFSRPYNVFFSERFRPSKASQWWMLSREAIEHLSDFLAGTPRYWRQYERSLIPDESFVQTAVLNGPCRTFPDNMRCIVWGPPGVRHPEVLTARDFPAIVASGQWFARKFDPRVCTEVLDRLDAHRRAATSAIVWHR